MMQPALLAILDGLLTVLHVAVVLAFTLLWLPRTTRRAHLMLVLATAFSWLGLGLVYGIGYCFLTDWHWQVKRLRGATQLPASFIHYALTHWLGVELEPPTTDVISAAVFVTVSGLAFANHLQRRRERRASSER